MAVTPDGGHLYVTSQGSSSVSAFSIASDGRLSAVTGSPFATGNVPFGVAVSPDGGHLYVTNESSGSVSAFSIAPTGA